MKIILALLIIPLALSAQQSGPVATPQPNCVLSQQLPLTGQTVAPFNSSPFDNRAVGCTDWTVTVEVPSTTSALSLVVQTAPDNGSGVPGSWSTFTAATGSNPNTLTTGWTATFSTGTAAYFAWLRIQLTSQTGTGKVFFKLRSSIAGGGGSGGGGSSGFPIACNQQALFNLSGSGNTQIIPLSGTNRTFICHLDFATASAEDIKITTGTGSNCAGSTADVTGLYKSISAMAQDYQAFSPLIIPAGQATCINQSVAQALGGVVIFAQAP